MKKINTKKIISTLIALSFFSTLLLITLSPFNNVFAANITESMTNQIKDFDLPSGGGDPEGKALGIVGKLINAFLSLFGVIFLILVIYGGYKWMLASGRDEEINSAKDIIKAAIIGLIIVMMSYAITYFVVSRLQGSI